MKKSTSSMMWYAAAFGLAVLGIAGCGSVSAQECPLGTSLCSGACVDSRVDSNNCGGCGITCAGGEVCNGSGVCEVSCQAGLTNCSGTCTDTNVDPNNCGGCDVGGANTCGTGVVCVAGACDVELFPFVGHTFTPCGATGPTGPVLADCQTAYGTPWAMDPAAFSVANGIQRWVVPHTGSYRITAAGASPTAGAPQQQGAVIAGSFALQKGDVLHLIVGQRPAGIDGGSGGTFVEAAVGGLLVAAGGAGGTCNPADAYTNMLASLTETAQSGNDGAGGTAGSGGQSACATSPYGGGAGGGYLTDGVDNDTTYGCPGSSFMSGGAGGTNSCGDTITSNGGFGGGGAGFASCEPGGGGGYSGGGGGGANNTCMGSANRAGGGGGSFNSGTTPTSAANNTGNGYVIIAAE